MSFWVDELSRIEEAAARVRRSLDAEAEIAVILGSGLGAFAETLGDAKHVRYDEIPHFPIPAVSGHSGELVGGRIAQRWVLVLSGRSHFYEGCTMRELVLPVRVLARLGVKRVVLTNSAGGIAPALGVGSCMIIRDHINMMGDNPLRGANLDAWGPRFPDMSEIYSRRGREVLGEVATKLGIAWHEGVYAAVSGPSYETPAEVHMLRTLGADAVGMSTVPEAIAACHAGLEVAGVSLITNRAAGLTSDALSHEEVQLRAHEAKEPWVRFLTAVVHRFW